MVTRIRAASLRKLAAIDIVFLGPKFVIAEYSVGVFLATALGLFTLFRGGSFWQLLMGVYLVCLGVNYTPMLVYAVAIGSKRKAEAKITDELRETRKAMARYRRYSLLLLIPLAAPILAILQRRSEPER